MDWLAKLGTNLQQHPDPQPLRTKFDAHGITQVCEHSTVNIAWQDVTDIIAYKKDCFTVDQIRLEIGSTGQNIVCTEDDRNFEGLVTAIATHLPGSMPDWYPALVSSPAFQTTPTRVYPASQ